MLSGLVGMSQMSTQVATDLVGRLAHADVLKTAIRDGGGLSALVRQLRALSPKEETLENCTRALTVLLINNHTNQDQLRYAHMGVHRGSFAQDCKPLQTSRPHLEILTCLRIKHTRWDAPYFPLFVTW